MKRRAGWSLTSWLVAFSVAWSPFFRPGRLPSHNVRLAKPNSTGVYVRHRPETTLLYQIVQEYWPEFQGLLENDTGNIYLTPQAMDASDEDPSNQLLGSSITYRVAVGPHQGRKVFTLQTLPDIGSDSFRQYPLNVCH